MLDVFSIVPVYAFVGEEPHVTYRILLNVEDSAVAQSVFHPYVFICLRRSYERQKEYVIIVYKLNEKK